MEDHHDRSAPPASPAPRPVRFEAEDARIRILLNGIPARRFVRSTAAYPLPSNRPGRCTIHPETTLRPIADQDLPFLFHVYASTRVEELAPVPWTDEQKLEFLAMQFRAQHEHYAVHYEGGDFNVILVDGEPAGRLYLYRGERDLRIVDIAFLPQFRGKGMGTRLIREVLEEGDRTGKTVSIHVEYENPARSLYDRLGFLPAGEAGVYVLMERAPAAPAPAAD